MWAQQLREPLTLHLVETPTLTETDVPTGHVLVRTTAGGICGSDLPYFRGAISPELPSGGNGWPPRAGFPMHEITGTVLHSKDPAIVAGSEVVGWACDSDGLAELVVCRGDELHAYAPSGRPAAVAVVMQPLACVLYAVDQLGDVADANVAVIGQGPIGLLFDHVLAQRGARTVVGVDRIAKAGIATTLGASDTVQIPSDRWAQEFTGERPDIIVEAVGHQTRTLNDAIDVIAPGGEIYYFGVPDQQTYPVHFDRFLRKNVTLRAGITRDRTRMLREAERYLDAYPTVADVIVTDTIEATNATQAFAQALSPHANQGKITLTMA